MSFDLYAPTEMHAQLRDMVYDWGLKHLEPQAADFDASEKFNIELFRRLATELQLFGVTVPESEGGAGLDATAMVIIMEELSRFDPGFVLSYLAHEVLFVHNVHSNATPEQRKRFLPKAMDGTWICGMAMSEPGGGTDVLGMKTKAVRDGDHYIINGTKQWITNGPYGDAFLVYARTGEGPHDISAFVVETATPGVSAGRKESKMGMRGSPTSTLIFEDCRVPKENLLIEENKALICMMRNLEIERVTLAAQSTGIALRCIDEMGRYATSERKAFGQYLSEFGQIQRMIAESYSRTAAARALMYDVARQISPTSRNSAEADATKIVATDVGEWVSRQAIQVFGGYGYSREYPIERLHRDAILLSIGGGTTEALQKNILRDMRKRYR